MKQVVELPQEIWCLIVELLERKELGHLSSVCISLNNLALKVKGPFMDLCCKIEHDANYHSECTPDNLIELSKEKFGYAPQNNQDGAILIKLMKDFNLGRLYSISSASYGIYFLNSPIRLPTGDFKWYDHKWDTATVILLVGLNCTTCIYAYDDTELSKPLGLKIETYLNKPSLHDREHSVESNIFIV